MTSDAFINVTERLFLVANNGNPDLALVIDPEADERWRLSRREDLADAFGIVLSVAWHGRDAQGNWRYGLNPLGGMPNGEYQAQFESDMRALIREVASGLAGQGVITEEQVATLNFYPYSVGPAAQEWPKIFFDLYQDARPFLADGASLLAWGYFFKDTFRAIRTWASNKERAQSEYPDCENVTYSGHDAMPSVTLTRPAIVALCYTDLVDRHAVTGDLTIETFPRSFTSYATVDHPGGGESYILRARAGRHSFFYHVDGTGEVSEHYLIVDSTLTPLPLPNLRGDETTLSRPYALPSQQVKIKGR